MFPDEFVRPMREELTRVGFQELRTPQEVDAALQQEKRTVLVVVNSVCGCAAGKARPAVAMALANQARPRIFHRVCPVVPFHRLAARWQACLHDGAIKHRKPRCTSYRR